MKKLIKLLFVAVIVIGCTQDYKDVKPKGIEGVELQIDSAKWIPALIQIDGNLLTIYESNEIRTVRIYDGGNSVATLLFVVYIIFVIGFFVGLTRDK